MNISKEQLIEILDQYGWGVQEDKNGDCFVEITDLNGDRVVKYVDTTTKSVAKFFDYVTEINTKRWEGNKENKKNTMKVFNVYATDSQESVLSVSDSGTFSTIELARKKVKSLLDKNAPKVIIQATIVDEDNSVIKFEVYDFKNGLECKAENSDAKLGFLNKTERFVDFLNITYIGKNVDFNGNNDFLSFYGRIDSFSVDTDSNIYVTLIDQEGESFDVSIKDIDLPTIDKEEDLMIVKIRFDSFSEDEAQEAYIFHRDRCSFGASNMTKGSGGVTQNGNEIAILPSRVNCSNSPEEIGYYLRVSGLWQKTTKEAFDNAKDGCLERVRINMEYWDESIELLNSDIEIADAIKEVEEYLKEAPDKEIDDSIKNSIFLVGDPVKWGDRKENYTIKTVFFDNGLRYSLLNKDGVECGCRVCANELAFSDLCTSFQMRGIAIEHNESALYVKKTSITEKMIQHYQFFDNIVTFTFIDGITWYHLPFAYNDFWEKKIVKY